MLTLYCMDVGAKRCGFTVSVDADSSVASLKKSIKEECGATIPCVAAQLELFLAIRDGEWLTCDDPLVHRLEDGTARDELEEMIQSTRIHPAKSVQKWLEENKMTGARAPKPANQLHVLVIVPHEAAPPPKVSSFAMQLKKCNDKGNLPTEGEFLKLFEWTDSDCGKVVDITAVNAIVGSTGSRFYVRKEVLGVLKNVMTTYHADFNAGSWSEIPQMQFVLMGSPGTGKSTLLALICFYIAIRNHYTWDDADGKVYSFLYDEMREIGKSQGKFWLCLDGLCSPEIRSQFWESKFTLLATSGQYDIPNGAMELQRLCLMPYWRRDDLEDLAQKLTDLDEDDVESRYFVSGGNLRDFLRDDAVDEVSKFLSRVDSQDAANLLSPAGAGSSKQIDRLRSRGVHQVNNAGHYTKPQHWSCIVSAKYVLQGVVNMVEPRVFQTMIETAKAMNDGQLEGKAFEAYFHAMVRRKSTGVCYYKYDNVNRTEVPEGKSIMQQEVGSIVLTELECVKREGRNQEECQAVMERWAKTPGEMDYWIPDTSLCETIDAVAKCKLPDNQVRFCFLQLTKATTHKCDASVLWKFARPFVKNNLLVCYIAVLPHDKKEDIFKFRLRPVEITKQEILDHVPLYVAHVSKAKNARHH